MQSSQSLRERSKLPDQQATKPTEHRTRDVRTSFSTKRALMCTRQRLSHRQIEWATLRAACCVHMAVRYLTRARLRGQRFVPVHWQH